ncbi:MAG: TIR domain-containing protein [Terricaulis sp.]
MNERTRISGLKVFLSYSRTDREFVEQLAKALEAKGFVAVFDLASRAIEDRPDLVLSPQDEWWAQLKSMIAGCDVMVFVVSPASAKSTVCDDEIAHAKSLGKRIIPILIRDIALDAAPERLRALNIKIDFRNSRAFEAVLAELVVQLEVDMEWHRRGARLVAQAYQWSQDGRPQSQLLRLGAIAEADAWASNRPLKAAPSNDLLLEFLAESRKREQADSLSRQLTAGRAFVKPAAQALEDERHSTALRLTAAGMILSQDYRLTIVPELEKIGLCRRAAVEDRIRVAISHPGAVATISFNQAGDLAVVGSFDATAQIVNCVTGDIDAVLRGHAGPVMRAMFSRDGSRIVTASKDGSVAIWSANNYELKTWIRCPDEEISDLFFADGDTIAVISKRFGEARIRSKGGDEILLSDHVGWVRGARFCRCGKHAATSDDKSVRVWDVRNGRQLVQFETDTAFTWHLQFSPDCQRIAAGLGKKLQSWPMGGGPPTIFSGHTKEISALVFDESGARLVSGSHDRTARVWDSSTGQELAVLRGHGEYLTDVAPSKDGTRILTRANDNSARIWDMATGEQLGRLWHDDYISAAAFSPDGKHVITGSHDATTCVWDIGGAEVHCFRAAGREARALAFSADGATLAVGAEDGSATIWDCATGARIVAFRAGHSVNAIDIKGADNSVVMTFSHVDEVACVWDGKSGASIARVEGERVHAAALSPDGKTFSTASGHLAFGRARIWSVAERRQVHRLEHIASVNGVVFDASGMRLATSSTDYGIRVWDAQSGEETAKLVGHTDHIRGLKFDVTGERILSWSQDNTVRFWDSGSGENIWSIANDAEVQSACISPDGTLIAVARLSGDIEVLNVNEQMSLAFCIGHSGRVNTVSFHQDSTRLLSASADETVRIWDAKTGAEIMRLQGHTGDVHDARFSPCGSLAASCSTDGTARIWDIGRSAAGVGEGILVVASGLSKGNGRRCASEQYDLLMQAAPDDILANIAAQLTSEELFAIPTRIHILNRSFEGGGYQTPSQRGSHSNPVAKALQTTGILSPDTDAPRNDPHRLPPTSPPPSAPTSAPVVLKHSVIALVVALSGWIVVALFLLGILRR